MRLLLRHKRSLEPAENRCKSRRFLHSEREREKVRDVRGFTPGPSLFIADDQVQQCSLTFEVEVKGTHFSALIHEKTLRAGTCARYQMQEVRCAGR